MLIADVYVNIPVKSIATAYSYLVPPELPQVAVGWRVLVPFGNRQIEGFVVAIHGAEESQIPTRKLKYISNTIDEEPWFSPIIIELARELSQYYLCSMGEIMRLFMPGKSGVVLQLQYEAQPQQEDHMLLLVDMYLEVYQFLLAEGPQKKNKIKAAMVDKECFEAVENLDHILATLVKYKVLHRIYDAQSRANKQTIEYVHLSQKLEESVLASFHRKPAQQRLLKYLEQLGDKDITLPQLIEAGFGRTIIKNVLATGLLKIEQRRVLRDSYQDFQSQRQEVQLTQSQQTAVTAINEQLQAKENKVFLLHGVTGSGKTQVYIETAKKARELGRRVVVLVPEIALTGQVVQAFKGYFPQDIIVMHSRLSVSERNDAIVRVRQQEAGIIIGARSALFTPVDDVGLIILDEEQDNSYKQDEAPRYHARVVAEKMAKLNGGVLLLGSATPSLESYYQARKQEYQLLTLPQRIGNKPLPLVKAVDMRQELKIGRRNIISLPLQQLLEQTIAKGEQMILMLNRRGYSTFVMCRSCGEVIKCPQCTMPMVYHQDGRLLCHHCDIQAPVPDTCPKCGSRYIKFFGSGTEKLEAELQTLVPQARVVRMDRDTTTGKFGHSDILNKFRRGEYDILLGTQMVAKGHDIPNVTAVGIISADSALHMPDFRAAERVFMLITQTAGRAGRGEVPGRVIVQSYSPEHIAVEAGIHQDYNKFYQTEMKIRQDLFYPPFCRLIKLIFQDEEAAKAQEAASKVKEALEEHFALDFSCQILGPAPALIANFRGISRYLLLIKTKNLLGVQEYLTQMGLQKDNKVIIDIDPITTS